MRKISACIVSYNGADEVIRAVESLLKYTKDCALTVYLVDNASPDGAGETLERQGFPENVKVIRLPENLEMCIRDRSSPASAAASAQSRAP